MDWTTQNGCFVCVMGLLYEKCLLKPVWLKWPVCVTPFSPQSAQVPSLGSCYTKLVAITQGAPKEQKLCVSKLYKIAMVWGFWGGKNLGSEWKNMEKP